MIFYYKKYKCKLRDPGKIPALLTLNGDRVEPLDLHYEPDEIVHYAVSEVTYFFRLSASNVDVSLSKPTVTFSAEYHRLITSN